MQPIRELAITIPFRLVAQGSRRYVQRSVTGSGSWKGMAYPIIESQDDAGAIKEFTAWLGSRSEASGNDTRHPSPNTHNPLPSFHHEEAFLQAVRDLAHLHGWQTYHTRNSKGSDPGIPDLLLRRNNMEMWIELKLENRKKNGEYKEQPSAEQCEFLEWCQCRGKQAHLFRPSDWPEIEQLLKGRAE